MSTTRQYAGIVGVVLLLIGIVGVIMALGSTYSILGLNIDWTENVVHLATGALMAYVGFAQSDNALARMIVGVLGAIYLLVGILGFLSTTLFGLIPHGYSALDNIVHLLLGILGLVVAYALPRNDVEVTTTTTTTRNP